MALVSYCIVILDVVRQHNLSFTFGLHLVPLLVLGDDDTDSNGISNIVGCKMVDSSSNPCSKPLVLFLSLARTKRTLNCTRYRHRATRSRGEGGVTWQARRENGKHGTRTAVFAWSQNICIPPPNV